jgi:hypothetical protein
MQIAASQIGCCSLLCGGSGPPDRRDRVGSPKESQGALPRSYSEALGLLLRLLCRAVKKERDIRPRKAKSIRRSNRANKFGGMLRRVQRK